MKRSWSARKAYGLLFSFLLIQEIFLSSLLYFGRKEVKKKLYNDDVRKNIINAQNYITLYVKSVYLLKKKIN